MAQEYPLPAPPAVSTATRLEYTADHLDYDSGQTMLHLKGKVVIKESTRTIKAEELWLDTSRRSGRSDGYLFVEDGDGAVAGESGEFDFEDGSGRLSRASAGYGDWRIHAREVKLSGRRKLDYLGANFTSCDFRPPHYHFHASRITVVPRKHLLARNVVFFLGPVPLFYAPFLYKSLKPSHFFKIKVQPGYDRRNGPYLKGTLFTQYSPWLYSKLYLDYYGAQGPGTGVELERRKGDDRGVLFGYRIRETSSGTERWALLGSQYQSVISSVAFQGRLQVQSDADFNNHYARSSTLRVTPELVNSAAFVYRRPQVTMRLSYSRQDVASANRIKFLKAAESSPRLDVQSAPLSLWRLPWLNTFTGFADHTYLAGRPFIQKSAGGGWEGTRTFNLARGISFTPKVGLQETFFDKTEAAGDFLSTATLVNAFIGRYLTENTLRWATPVGDWDLTHAYTRRLKADSSGDDAGSPDHGVEANLLSLRHAYRPARTVFVRASSGYDFRVFRDRSVGFRERVQPIVGEISYTPRTTLNFSLRDDYQLQQGNRSFIASALWGDETGTFLSGAAGYNISAPGRYAFDTQFAVANASATWRAGASLRSQLASAGGIARASVGGFQLYEKELSLAHAWHDFFTRVMLRFRPGGVREVTARIDLRFGKSSGRESGSRRDWESEWFPERASGIHDRP